MNYIEDRIANETGILIVGLMPSPDYKHRLENIFFNGRRELFWEFALEHDIVPTDDMQDLVENYYFSFIYLVNEAHQSFNQVDQDEVQEGIEKVKRFINSAQPSTVLLVGKQIALHWWGRPIRPCGPIENDMYILPGVVPNPTFTRQAIEYEFKRCGEWLLN